MNGDAREVDVEPPGGGEKYAGKSEAPPPRWMPSREGSTPAAGAMPINLETALRYGFGDAAIRRYQWLVESAGRAGVEDGLSKAYNDLGDAYAYVDETVNALRQFRRAIKVCPKRAEPHFSLAEFYRRNGKTPNSLKEYRRAIELSPYNPFYHYRLGEALSEAGFDIEAVAELETAVDLAPNDPFYNPANLDLFRRLGIDTTVSSTQIIFNLLEQQIEPGEIIPLAALKNGNIEIVAITVSNKSPVLGRTIRDLPLPGNALIISVVRNDNALLPQADTRFETDDTVIAMVVADEEPQLRRIFAEH